MEKLTEHLTIKDVWWVWRGCLQDYGYGYGTRYVHIPKDPKDPMDSYGYDELSAFPMRKPNFDVFGVPSRTRTQRGWYKVQKHPKARPLNIPSTSRYMHSHSTPPAVNTGADLPWELVEMVGKTLSVTLHRTEDRRTMMACALVCRYWANHFLCRIFETVRLHSRQCAVELRAFDRSPTCWFFQCYKPTVTLGLESTGLLELSCVHLVTQTRCKALSTLALEGPLPPSWKTMRSVHQALPRPVPGVFSSNIATLNLTDIRFQRFSDLVHLAVELPHLQELCCTKVTWGPLPATIGRVPHRRVSQGGEPRTPDLKISMKDVSGPWAKASIHILAHCISHTMFPFFSDDNLSAIIALVSLYSNVDTPTPNLASGSISYNKSRQLITLIHCGPKRLDLCIQATTYASPDQKETSLDVTCVTVQSNAQDSKRRAFDWAKFDKHVSTLNPKCLVFGFETRELLLTFAYETVVSMMPFVSAHKSIKYAVWHEEWWHKTSLSTETLDSKERCADLQNLY